VRRLLERDLEVVAQVGAAIHARARAPLPEDVAEDLAERVGEVREARAAAACHAGLRIHAGMAEPVVRGALLFVGEDLVGLLRLLEVLLGLRVVGVAVRMPLHRELPIGLLDGLLVRVAIDPEHLVVVALGHAAKPVPR